MSFGYTSGFRLFLVTSLLLKHTESSGENAFEMDTGGTSQVLCPLILLKKYFQSAELLSGAVLTMSFTSASVNVQQNLLKAMHADSSVNWTIVVNNMDRDRLESSSSGHILHEKPQCYFVLLENLEDEDLEEIFEMWRTAINWNPMAQFVVYLASVEQTIEEMTELMIDIMLTFMNQKIFNVNVIGQNEEDGYYYGKTVFPYHPDNDCGNRVISIETLDICDYQESEMHESDYNENDRSDENGGDDGKGDDYNDQEEPNYSGNEPERDRSADSDENDQQDPNGPTIDSYDQSEAVDRSNQDNSYGSEKISAEVVHGSDYAADKETKGSYQLVLVKTRDDEEEHNFTSYPKLTLKEVYRATVLDKFPSDLSGCPLLAGFRSWEPYIFNEAASAPADYEDIEDANDTGKYTVVEESYSGVYENVYGTSYEEPIGSSDSKQKLAGIEYLMVQTIAEHLHIDIDLHVENSNLYHLFQQLIDGNIELIVGGIDEDPSISQFVSSTIPYHQDELTWCVAKAERDYNLFNFLQSFTPTVWALTFLYIGIAALSIYFVRKYFQMQQHYMAIVLRVFATVLSQSMPLGCLPGILKLILLTVFFMALLFSNIYQSFLVSTLTTPKSAYQISHIQEIVKYKMDITGSVDNVRHINKPGEAYRYIREKFEMCYNMEECLSRAARDKKLAVAVSRQHLFYNPDIPRDQLYCFDRDENVYVYLVTMLLPKKFHLLHKINPIIQHIIESGFIQKWAQDLDTRRIIQEEVRKARELPVESLKLDQIAGTFVLHGILTALALIVFLMEIWVHWMVTKRRTRIRIVKLFHRKLQQA